MYTTVARISFLLMKCLMIITFCCSRCLWQFVVKAKRRSPHYDWHSWQDSLQRVKVSQEAKTWTEAECRKDYRWSWPTTAHAERRCHRRRFGSWPVACRQPADGVDVGRTHGCCKRQPDLVGFIGPVVRLRDMRPLFHEEGATDSAWADAFGGAPVWVWHMRAPVLTRRQPAPPPATARPEAVHVRAVRPDVHPSRVPAWPPRRARIGAPVPLPAVSEAVQLGRPAAAALPPRARPVVGAQVASVRGVQQELLVEGQPAHPSSHTYRWVLERVQT